MNDTSEFITEPADVWQGIEGAQRHELRSDRRADRLLGVPEVFSGRPLSALPLPGESPEVPAVRGLGQSPIAERSSAIKAISADPANAGKLRGRRPLGSNTGFAATPKTLGEDARQGARHQRWKMARTAGRIAGLRRLKSCGHLAVDGQVQIYKKDGKAFYKGVMTCGLLWACPVCATKISEQRKQELAEAIEGYRGVCLLLTRTIRHSKWDRLETLLPRLREAQRWYGKHRVVRTIRERFNATPKRKGGTVRNLEVTHAHPDKWDHNGWHPHEHEVWFCGRRNITQREIREAELVLGELWIEACRRAGLPDPDLEHGLKLEANQSAGEYVAKWGLAAELTKSHIKEGKNGSLSPWGLLTLAHDGNEKAGQLFSDFTRAFKGRKQLQWSRGLRDSLGLKAEKTDEQLADSSDVEASFQCGITLDDWRLVRRRGDQTRLLSIVENSGVEAVFQYLESVRIDDLRRTRDGP